MKKRLLLIVAIALAAVLMLSGCEMFPCKHEYGEAVVLQDATCAVLGISEEECVKCGEKKTSTIPLKDHDYGDWGDSTATCTEAGEQTRECKGCDKTETREAAAKGHTMKSVEGKESTCTEAGYNAYEECDVCGDNNKVLLPLADHVKSDESVEIGEIVSADCESKGSVELIFKCAVCTLEIERVIIEGEEYGHKYDFGVCTVCGENDPDYSGEWWDGIAYDETDLIFQMTHCSNNQELSSGCERYLAGESADANEIDRLVEMRNEAAYVNTNVRVTYRYYDDVAATYGYSNCIDLMFNETLVSSQTSPDMYCNFMTDMLVASLKGAFANVHSRRHGEGEYAGMNYFRISEENGYMADLMNSLSLSESKQYVIASDYFIDLVRAFMVVPVNVRLYNSIAKDMIADYNKDEYININDFFVEIFDMKWTYTRLAEYCQRIFAEGTAGVSGTSMDDTLGFALGRNGLPAAGLVYSSSVDIISEEWRGDGYGYDYYYPEENNDLFKLADAIKLLFNQRGVLCVTRDDAQTVDATTENLGVRTKFVNDQLLFGGIILLGSIEYDAYQNMKKSDDGGFGIVPVPLYRDGSDDKYQTAIHVIGRAGAIARNTKKFVQCSAFLQYQSEHSTDILNQYYDYNLTYEAADGFDGNVDMLKYLRQNVRSSFDMLYEDAIAFMFLSGDPDSYANRWHNIICTNDYQVDLRSYYREVTSNKDWYLDQFVKQYETLPE